MTDTRLARKFGRNDDLPKDRLLPARPESMLCIPNVADL